MKKILTTLLFLPHFNWANATLIVAAKRNDTIYVAAESFVLYLETNPASGKIDSSISYDACKIWYRNNVGFTFAGKYADQLKEEVIGLLTSSYPKEPNFALKLKSAIEKQLSSVRKYHMETFSRNMETTSHVSDIGFFGIYNNEPYYTAVSIFVNTLTELEVKVNLQYTPLTSVLPTGAIELVLPEALDAFQTPLLDDPYETVLNYHILARSRDNGPIVGGEIDVIMITPSGISPIALKMGCR
jgi:hypothetical protein